MIDQHFRDRWRAIVGVDDMVGLIHQELEKLGVLDNTYMFYSSDRAETLPPPGCRGHSCYLSANLTARCRLLVVDGYKLGEWRIGCSKQHPYETDIRVPLFIRGPGIKAGSTVAGGGATGAGKSTLVRLLLRLYEPRSGSITVDGIPIQELDLGALRGAIGLVSQSVFLFSGTVRENIAYGSFGATDDQIQAAARAAEAAEFIGALPEGLDTRVGERGQKLSGGQQQRLSLARAILKDPPILVLDEATSAVDNVTEAAIQRSLERVSADRTTIVIAHRLSTIRHADLILVMEAGRLVASGTHEALLARGGVYAELWRVQTGARAWEDAGGDGGLAGLG